MAGAVKPRRPRGRGVQPKKASRPKPGVARGDDVGLLRTRIAKLEGLLDVAKAMTAERSLDTLLKLIVSEAARVVDADRCSLWIIDRERNQLWTKVAHGLADGAELRIPIGSGVAGQVATTGTVINITDAYADARFNRQVDKDTGYHTRNMLGVPMHSPQAR